MKYRSKTTVGYGERQVLKEVNNPFHVECPRCGSPAGVECETKSGFRSRVHIDRWKAIGISKPSLEDWEGAWWLSKERELQLVKERIEKRKV